MTEKNIRLLFDAASHTEETGINSEEIKNDVLRKLGKKAMKNLTNNKKPEEISPVYVTPQSKKVRIAPIITAAATAACLGVVSVSTGFFGLVGGGASPLSPNSDPPQTETTTTEETVGTVSDEAIQTTASVIDLNALNNTVKLYLLDGSSIINIVWEGEYSIGIDTNTDTPLLSEEQGRLYFVKNAREAGLDHKELAIKEDITDKISYDDFYIYSYENPDNKEYSTHYVIVGGSIEDYDYGYLELFKEEGVWKTVGRETFQPPAKPYTYAEIPTTPGPRWFINAVLELEANYGEKIFGHMSGGGGQTANFKYVWANDVDENDQPPERPDDPKSDEWMNKWTAELEKTEAADKVKWLGEKMPFANDSFTLKDGSTVIIHDDGIQVDNSAEGARQLLKEKDGRLYYMGNEEPKDITDLISEENPFVVSYKNEGSGQVHYIAIGGNVSAGKYAYVDMFRLYEKQIYVHEVAGGSMNTADINDSMWLSKAVKEMAGDNADNMYLFNGDSANVNFAIEE